MKLASAKTHLRRVLMKLGLRDRVAAVIFAYESGLMNANADRDGLAEVESLSE